MEFRTISSQGRSHVVSVAGDGPDVVLLHGFPDTPHSWEATQTALADQGWRVSVPWLRGYHPDTIVAGRGYDPETLGRDVLDLLDAIDARTAVVVGHDWGALMAYAAATLAPERTDAIVTLGIPHPTLLPRTPRGLWAGRHFFRHKLPGAVRACRRRDFARLDMLYRRWAPSWTGPEREASLHDAKEAFALPGTLEAALRYYQEVPLTGIRFMSRLPEVPGLIVGGTEDGGEPEAYRRTAAGMPPPSRALIVDGTGHWPHREAAAKVLPEIVTYLAERRAA